MTHRLEKQRINSINPVSHTLLLSLRGAKHVEDIWKPADFKASQPFSSASFFRSAGMRRRRQASSVDII